MKIINHFLFNGDDKQVTYKLTPNRGGLFTPKYLIMHYDAAKNATSAIEWMLSPKSKVSAHLHISRDGQITQLAPFNIICWHAGASKWDGLNGLNSHSIGIELQNDGKQDYTEIQLCVCLAVSEALVAHYNLKDVLGHSDIAPGRKIDPGPKFPMSRFKPNKSRIKKASVNLNVRSGAGVGNSVVDVIGQSTIVEEVEVKGDWSRINVVNSEVSGWVANRYLI